MRSKLLATALVAAALSACGSASSPTGLRADPAGVLLAGDAESLALDALVDMVPSAAPADTVVDGFMTTRLEALIELSATVADVNQALTDAGAAIVSMRAGFPVVTLVVPPQADAAAAAMLADELAATDGFGLVTAAFVPAAPGVVVELAAAASSSPAFAASALATAHLDAMRMTAARNARNLLVPGSFPVLVPSTYSQTTPHQELSAQLMLAGPGRAEGDGELGNWGFTTCGILGTDPDNMQFAAVHPDPVQSLELRSILTSGLTWTERVFEITDRLPAGKFVLNTGQNYGPDLGERSKLWRCIDALAWRKFAAHPERFVHLTSAGDSGAEDGATGQAAWATPFALSESFRSLAELVESLSGELTEEERAQFANATLALGEEPPPLGNLRIVGSSRPSDHSRSSFSCAGEDLRVIGEEVLGLCLVESAGCDGTGTLVTSTRAATAQVSGLFAWLWTLAPERSAAELLELVDRAWFNGATPGLVDAYYATLALDDSLFDPRVRRTLLDVAANTDASSPVGNGSFDHHDLKVFVDAFEAGTDLRYDLNGDGQVGGDGTAMFDLDVNAPPEFGAVSQLVEGQMHDYAESAVSDLEVLCYYAYSSLYVGNTQARTILLAECNGVPEAGIYVLDTTRTAVAYSGDSFTGPEESAQSTDTEAFAGTASSEASQDEDTSVGLSSSSTTHNSQFGFDIQGNLASLTAGGAGAAEFSLTNAGNWTQAGPDAGSVSRTDLRFRIVGGDVPFRLELNADGSWDGDESIGEYGYVKINIHLTDNDGNDYTDYDFETPEGALPTFQVLEGVLPGDLFGAEFELSIRVFTHASYNFETSTPPPLLSASASSSWDVTFTLTP